MGSLPLQCYVKYYLLFIFATPLLTSKGGRNFPHRLEYAEAKPGHLKACCWIGVLDHDAPLDRTLFEYILLLGCTFKRSSGSVVNGSDSDKLVFKS